MCVVASCVRRIGCVPWSVAPGGSLGNPREAFLGRFWDLLGLDGGTLSSKSPQERVRKAVRRLSSLEASGSPQVLQGVRGGGSWELFGASWGPFGGLLGASWGLLRASWGPLGGLLTASWGRLGGHHVHGGKMEAPAGPQEAKHTKSPRFFKDFRPLTRRFCGRKGLSRSVQNGSKISKILKK